MSIYRVLLPHPLESRLLMMHSHGEWRLPEWEDGARRPWHAIDHVNRAVSARFGMECTVLRCVSAEANAATGRETRVYELDNHSAPHDMVPGATWVGRAELNLLRVTDPVARELVGEWFSRDSGELPLRGPAWSSRGWYVEALAWTVAQLRELGITARGTPTQVRAGERGFLMRIATDDGAYHFHAAPEMFRHEPALAGWLAGRYPDNFPDVVSVDRARGWFLQREPDEAALPLAEVREEEEWYRAVRRLAEIQADTTSHITELRGLGIPYRGLELLARRIPRLCADASAMMLGEPGGLTRAEIERVASLAPTLLALCSELAGLDLPDALEHGDLPASSVLSTLSGPIYLDWSEAAISHPFFSVALLMSEAAGLLPASSRETRRRLRANYLKPWRSLAPEPVLVRAFELARVLAPVHLAATAHAEQLPVAGYRWEVAPAVPRYLRLALQLLLDESAPIPA